MKTKPCSLWSLAATALFLGVALSHDVADHDVTDPTDEVAPPVPVFCTKDAKICPDGSSVGRDPRNRCDWYPCPPFEPKCCDPQDIPPSIEGAKCCGATGEWVSSIGDGITFTCNGWTSSGPTYPFPFGKPCPFECKDVKDKQKCRDLAEEKGCHWLYGEKVCVSEDDRKCEEIKKKGNCKDFSKCVWKNDRCIPKPRPDICPRARPGKICPDVYKPVKCGDCEYGNICEAKAAGFKKTMCSKVCKSDRNCRRKKGEICYTGFDKSCDVDCPIRKRKVCKGVCIKSSKTRCGGFAGHRCPAGEMCVDKKGDKCSPNCGGSDCEGICVDAKCPKPRNKPCPRIYRPVICGNNCRYSNSCIAKAAGYSEKECRPEDSCPKPRPAKCPKILRPVICGNDCKYSNSCLARAAGFKDEQCKPDKCRNVKCPLIKCAKGWIPQKKDGECCHSCVRDCSKTLCPIVDCKRGYKNVKDPNGCCDTCVKDDDPCIGKPDCRTVRCARPDCKPGETLFTPPGECCPKCYPQIYCFAACDEPVCQDDEVMMKLPNNCCSTCEKKCLVQ